MVQDTRVVKRELNDRQQQFWEMLEEDFEEGRQEFGRENLLRVYEFIKYCKYEKEIPELPELQEGAKPWTKRRSDVFCQKRSVLFPQEIDPEFFPGLTAKPWWNVEELDNPEWVEKVVAGLPYVQGELADLLEDNEEYLISDSVKNEVMGGGWSGFRLRRLGAWLSRNCELFPKTVQLLKQSDVPLAMRGVIVARQVPGTGVQPHSDGRNFFLTAHFGLSVPPDCEERPWKEDDCIVFDTSFMHSTRNDSDEESEKGEVRRLICKLSEKVPRALEWIYDFRNKFEQGKIKYVPKLPDGFWETLYVYSAWGGRDLVVELSSDSVRIRKHQGVLKAIGSGGQCDQGLGFASEKGLPDVRVAIRSLGNATFWQEGLRLLQTKLRAPHTATARMYSAAVTILDVHQWPLVLELLEAQLGRLFQTLGLPSAKIQASKRHGVLDVEELSASLFHSVDGLQVDLNACSFNTAIHSCSLAGNWLEAIQLLKAMWTELTMPDIISYNTVIWACSTVGGVCWFSGQRLVIKYHGAVAGWRVAMDLLHEVWLEGLPASMYTFTGAILACAKAGQWPRALQLLSDARTELLLPDVPSHAAAIHACSQAAQWQQSLLLLKDMAGHKTWPDAVTFNSVIISCARGLQWRWSLRLVSDMVLDQVPPDVVTYRAMVDAYQRSWKLIPQTVA
eukprot:g9371.t1